LLLTKQKKHLLNEVVDKLDKLLHPDHEIMNLYHDHPEHQVTPPEHLALPLRDRYKRHATYAVGGTAGSKESLDIYMLQS